MNRLTLFDWFIVGTLVTAVLIGFIVGSPVWAALISFIFGWSAGQVTLWSVGWRRPPYREETRR